MNAHSNSPTGGERPPANAAQPTPRRSPLDWDVIRERLRDEYRDPPNLDALVEKLQYIDEMKRKKNAAILAHYYQLPEIQLIADAKGDSLALALLAKSPQFQDRDLLISSTVHFMAEKIQMLSGKRTLIPDPEASCSIAEGINGAVVRRIREAFPRAGIVGYINTTAETKAELDSVCTSANAEQVMRNIPGEQAIMVPDHFFARNVAQQIIPTRQYLAYRGIERRQGLARGEIVLYDVHHPDDASKQTRIPLDAASFPARDKGTCIVHEEFTPTHVDYYAKTVDIILAHPEVSPEVRDAVLAHGGVMGGTQKMIEYLKTRPDVKTALYLTECSMAEPLFQAHPKKRFVTPCVICPYMKKNKVETLVSCLENEQYEVKVAPEIEARALRSLERMFELTSDTAIST